MKYNFPQLAFFSSIALLVFSVLFFVFLFMKTQDNNLMSTQSLKEWQIENQKIDEMQSLDRLIQSIEQEKILLDTHFAQSSDIVPFLNMFEKLAPSTGATAEVVNVSDDSKGLIVQIKVSGSFESIYKFLLLLENSPYELEFISMDMQKSSTEGTENTKNKISQWSATFDIKLLTFIK